jgi:DNA-binding CsgD family transcriptional regulator
VSGSLRILVVGPFLATRGAEVVPLSACERTTLCRLIAAPGTYQPVDDAGPAESLRSKLGASAVLAEHGVYACEPERMSVDAWELERLVDAGRARLDACDPVGAERALARALTLWRGPPLADLTTPDAVALRARIRELRGWAATGLAEARLQAGRPADAVADLEALVREEPLHERRWWLLMLALYRSGRRAEALATFSRARRSLIDAAGIEPGPDLRMLEDALHRDDRSLVDDTLRRHPGPRLGVSTASSSRLTGREHEVARLAGKGFTNKQIAGQLGTSVRTVGNQLQAAFAKLGIHDRRDLATDTMS